MSFMFSSEFFSDMAGKTVLLINFLSHQNIPTSELNSIPLFSYLHTCTHTHQSYSQDPLCVQKNLLKVWGNEEKVLHPGHSRTSNCILDMLVLKGPLAGIRFQLGDGLGHVNSLTH